MPCLTGSPNVVSHDVDELGGCRALGQAVVGHLLQRISSLAVPAVGDGCANSSFNAGCRHAEGAASVGIQVFRHKERNACIGDDLKQNMGQVVIAAQMSGNVHPAQRGPDPIGEQVLLVPVRGIEWCLNCDHLPLV